jgi:hypothetical protein
VLEDGEPDRIEVASDGAGCRGLGGQQEQDGQPCGIGEGLESVTSQFHDVAF